MTDRIQLLGLLDTLLQPTRFKDYCPNGLQVEGCLPIRKLASAVTASRAVIQAGIAAEADTLLVHHGLFWRGHDGRVTGWMRQRLGLLMAHDINLLAYHLPLDAHPELGNNAQLGLRLGLRGCGLFGEQDLGWMGESVDGRPIGNLQVLVQRVEQVLRRPPVAVQASDRPLRRIAWCTGGAQSYFEAAIAAGADVFLTGEISEPQAHLARESGVSYLACGHHATEQFGAPAIAAHVAATLGLEHVFLPDENPA